MRHSVPPRFLLGGAVVPYMSVGMCHRDVAIPDIKKHNIFHEMYTKRMARDR